MDIIYYPEAKIQGSRNSSGYKWYTNEHFRQKAYTGICFSRY